MFVNQVTDELSSLDMPQALLDLLIENSFDRERLLKMSIDDLAIILSIDIEAAKIIINSVTNYSNLMFHDMRELR
ncbi:MAG TPA: hypothetical protein VIP56_02585 [Nitrososphaeraceae archaeon]|jgi:hypothetical protein